MVELYIDADSCPKPLRAIILKAVVNRSLKAFFVADRPLKDVLKAYEEHTALLRSGIGHEEERRMTRSPITMVVVESGDDRADRWIVDHAPQDSLAVTRDIILADLLVQKGVVVLDDRGGVFTDENIAERLSLRNAMTTLREYGVFAEKHKPIGPKEIREFSAAFDREVTKALKRKG
ncbi:MAG: hypothetical protein GX911_02520 [Spirochaetales bacterium]|nr:hypothetical protein [Spirochaetales bacterium]